MVKIRHLGRVLLGLAALFAVSHTSVPTATAQVTATTVVSSLDDLATASTDGTWCVLYNTGRNWYIQDNLSSSLVTYSGTITSTSTDASAANGLKCMVKFVSTGTDNMYKIQTVSGKYFSTLTSNQAVSLVTSSDDAGTFTISTCATTGNYQLKESANSVNLEGGPSAVLGWGSDDLSSQSTNNGLYTISTVTLGDNADGTLATVTYNYSVDGTSFGSTTSTQFVGLTVDAPSAVDFLSVSSYDATTVVAADGTAVAVACSENLPFTITTDDANPYYYALDIHSDDEAKFTVGTSSFFLKGSDTSVAASDDDIKNFSLNEVPAEGYQWIIKGDLINGFTLYNRSATKYLTVETGNTENQATLSETATTFKIAKSTVTNTSIPNISDAFCLYIDGNTSDDKNIYLNHRDTESGVIKGWTSTDGGSTIIARPIGFFAQKYYNSNFAAYQDAPAGAIGTLKDADFTAAKAAIATLSSNACDETAAVALVEANTTLGACETIEVPSSFDGQYYRLYNKLKKQYATFSTTSSGTFYITSSTNDKSAGSVIAFTANGDDASTYTISSEGLALGIVTNWNANVVPGASTTGTFTITQQSNALFVIYNSNGALSGWEAYQYLHLANTNSGDGNVVGWEASADASQWYFVPAEEVEISLTNIDGTTYGTAFLPFDINGVSGATAYVGVSTSTADDGTTLTMTPATDVQASNGFVLIGENAATTATLTIASSSTTSAVLTGTLTGTATNDNYLVLGKGSQSQDVGFYKYAGALTSIPANKAYIDNSSTSAIHLNFGDAATGIDAATLVNGESNSAPVYDLSGRRVTKATRGLYIQGGKKYIAR